MQLLFVRGFKQADKKKQASADSSSAASDPWAAKLPKLIETLVHDEVARSQNLAQEETGATLSPFLGFCSSEPGCCCVYLPYLFFPICLGNQPNLPRVDRKSSTMADLHNAVLASIIAA